MMNEEEKLPDTSADQPAPDAPTLPPAPETAPKPPLNDQKKNALLRYMAVLFGVAFLLVALSFLIQMRNSNQEISQLSKSNASALQNAQQLQEQNRALTNTQKRLTEENTALLDALTATQDERDQIQADLNLTERTLTDERDRARKATDILARATQAYLDEDFLSCRSLLAEIVPLRVDAGNAAIALFEKLTALTTLMAE